MKLKFFFLYLQRAKKTLVTLERSHKACDELPAEIFHKWLTVLIMVGRIEDAIKVAQMGVTQHPSSVELWCQYLQLTVQHQEKGVFIYLSSFIVLY